ncbi:MAG TPA: diaminopimelate epimerase [Gemmatimonadaceae bacterium]|nr:diaminopimelate epimerase [Gemmatimonadaceae bacterium]
MTYTAGVARAELTFLKMSGSGNDFLVFDARSGLAAGLDAPETIVRLCARGSGVGADGVVFIEAASDALFRMRYHNADGSRAELCGNAALCSTRLAVELGLAKEGHDFQFQTDSGLMQARMVDGLPEILLAPVTEVEPSAPDIAPVEGEERLGYAVAGVPHLVVACASAEQADVTGRGSVLRRHPSLPKGANVNFVSASGSEWRYRTYERGVEAETLACGTGAVATAILLAEWGRTTDPVRLRTSSGEVLTVRLGRAGDEWHPSLSGPARIVYEGMLREY